MTEAMREAIRKEARFRGLEPFSRRIPLASDFSVFSRNSRMECDSNINALTEWIEKKAAAFTGMGGCLMMGSSSDAMRVALRLTCLDLCEDVSAPEGFHPFKVVKEGKGGPLSGHRVFVPDFAPLSLAVSVVQEGGEPFFIDASWDDWGMDPEALEIAFRVFPDTKIVIVKHPYGFPCQAKLIKRICEEHGAAMIEDAGDSLGARMGGRPCGGFGNYSVLGFSDGSAFNAALLAGESGRINRFRDGMLRQQENALEWKKADESVIHSMYASLYGMDKRVEAGKAVYERYMDGFDDDYIAMMPFSGEVEPAFRVSCITVEGGMDFQETRTEDGYFYGDIHGAASPMEIRDSLAAFGAEACPLWKPLHMYPEFRECGLATTEGGAVNGEYLHSLETDGVADHGSVAGEIYRCGICIPSDIGMTEEEQEEIIDIVHACFDERDWERRPA